jgi:hypothetical protein
MASQCNAAQRYSVSGSHHLPKLFRVSSAEQSTAWQCTAGHCNDIRQGFGLSKSHCEIYQASK